MVTGEGCGRGGGGLVGDIKMGRLVSGGLQIGVNGGKASEQKEGRKERDILQMGVLRMAIDGEGVKVK